MKGVITIAYNNLEKSIEYEKSFDYDKLVNEAVDSMETIVMNKEKDEFNF